MPRKGRRRSGCGSWAKLAARPCQSPGPSGIPALLLSRPSLTSDLQGLPLLLLQTLVSPSDTTERDTQWPGAVQLTARTILEQG